MIDYGIEVIRIAEFAWNKFEPQEGIFNFDFFDKFLNLAYKKGMKVIFCTPTATPPAWLTHNYHEVLNAKEDGTLYRHGMRKHYTYNSPTYRKFTARIVDKIASHYCSHPTIIGWQIDNELNCETAVFYSDSDHAAFRTYLKEKFKTLEALNDAMGTTFWNQAYTSWDEIHLTRPTVGNSNNPHLSLEEKRFISYSTINYCKLQADIIKKYKSKTQFITTNGIFGHLDSHEMTNSTLDFITYDSYPNFAFDTWTDPKKPENLNDRKSSWSLTNTRSISSNFGIYELLISPHATILTEETANILKAYVEQGGILIMGARTDYKDQYGRCPMRQMPGFASEICGVKVVDVAGKIELEKYGVMVLKKL